MELTLGLRPGVAAWLLLPTAYAAFSIPWFSSMQSYSSAQIRVTNGQAGLHADSSIVGGCSVQCVQQTCGAFDTGCLCSGGNSTLFQTSQCLDSTCLSSELDMAHRWLDTVCTRDPITFALMKDTTLRPSRQSSGRSSNQLVERQSCDAGEESCGNYCIPIGATCCSAAQGRYCDPGEECCGSGYCNPIGTECCGGGSYCDTGYSCCYDECVETGGTCCPSGQEACGDGCIDTDEICCAGGESYCFSGQQCTPDGSCCDANEQICGDGCIAENEVCCDTGESYCLAGQQCCLDSCIPEDDVCCDLDEEACVTGCMPSGSVCCSLDGGGYCSTGSTCSNDMCYEPTTDSPFPTFTTDDPLTTNDDFPTFTTPRPSTSPPPFTYTPSVTSVDITTPSSLPSITPTPFPNSIAPIWPGSGALLTGSCATPEYTLVDGGNTVYYVPAVGCAADRPECCPWTATTTAGPTPGGPAGYPRPAADAQQRLERCPDDYYMTSGSCCPSNFIPYGTAIGGVTPAVSSLSSLVQPPTLTAAVSSGRPTSAIVNLVWAMQYAVNEQPTAVGMSTETKIGVGVGVPVGVIALLLAAFFAWRVKRKDKKQDANTPVASVAAIGQTPQTSPPPMSQQFNTPGSPSTQSYTGSHASMAFLPAGGAPSWSHGQASPPQGSFVGVPAQHPNPSPGSYQHPAPPPAEMYGSQYNPAAPQAYFPQYQQSQHQPPPPQPGQPGQQFQPYHPRQS